MSALYLILNAEQAEAVRGATSPTSFLDPYRLVDGTTFVLPATVLSDPDHEPAYAVLSTFPQREVMEDEWPVFDPLGGP